MAQTGTYRKINFAKRETVLLVFLFLLLVLSALYPQQIIHYPSFIHWDTILTLTGLLIITTGLKESGYFNVFSGQVLKRLKSERSLAFFLMLFSVMLSAFLTNDITLFIVIPVTFSIQDLVKNDISRLIIFEAIAVNVGSTLTPIGNPQNIFLWHQWDISFMAFVLKMAPLVAILIGVLLLFVLNVFSKGKIKFSHEAVNSVKQRKSLFILSAIMLPVFIIALEMGMVQFLLPVVFLIYLVGYGGVLLKVDWLLLVLFMIIFIDFHIVSTIPGIADNMEGFNLVPAGHVYLFSGLVSQVISNVPAAVFISKFSDDWFAITYGVNVAGNGLVIGSLANIIALRMAGNPRIWLSFHKYSIPYFLVSGTLVYILFFIL